MIKRIRSFFTTKQALFIFILFVLFFPLKTQTYNVLTYVFDQFFMGGIVSEIYTYNFVGDLIGCEETAKLSTYEEATNFFDIIFWIRILISWFFWWLLYHNYKRTNTFNRKHWAYLFAFSFYLFDTIEYTYNAIFYYSIERIIDSYVRTGTCIITLFLAAHIFFKIFEKKERLQLIFIAFPASILSGFIWYMYLGPKLLPISTL